LLRLVVTLKKRVDAQQSRSSSALAREHILTDTVQVKAESFGKNQRRSSPLPRR
jgi:hypothetical protein